MILSFRIKLPIFWWSFVVGVVPLLGCTQPVPIAEPPRAVRTLEIVVAKGSETITTTGEVIARRDTEYSFLVGGRIARRFVEVGTIVEKGGLLARLDDQLVNGEVRAAEAELRSASSALQLADVTHSRLLQLASGESASRQQVDESAANLSAAAARRDTATVARDIARTQLTYTRLRAEEAGVVVAVVANQGQVVAPGQPVVRVATRTLDAAFSVSETVLRRATKGVKVKVSLASNRTLSMIGTVYETSPIADPVTRTYRIRVALETPTKELTIGATVIGEIEVLAGKSVTVPASALTREGDVPAVYLVNRGTHKLTRRKINVARYEADRVVVTSGLNTGESVVTAGVSKLRPGQLVALDLPKESPQ